MDRKKVIELYEELKSAIDLKASLDGWDSGPVMRMYRRRLSSVRSSVSQMLSRLKSDCRQVEVKDKFIADREGFQKVYISLHQSDGLDMVRWEVAIKILPSSLVGKRVFEDEASVREYISERGKSSQDGYVVAWVSADSLSAAKQLSKSSDHELVLMDGAISHKDVVFFVHANHATYNVIAGRLFVAK